MKNENSSEVHRILAKIGISEEEADVLIGHFVEKHLRNNCQIGLSINLDTDCEGDNRFIKMSYEVSLSNNDGLVLSSTADYCSVCVN